MYDTIIIGSGPAGMTAAIYAARREMNTLLIGKELGGQIIWASKIENYPGFKSIDNYDLIYKMQDQVSSLGVKIVSDEVVSLKKEGENFEVVLNKEKYTSKTVIFAAGLSPRKLGVPGEEEFNGRGVSYCANCDGPFYKEKIVAVVGGGNSALDAAEILSKIAKKVYLIHRRQEFRGFEALVDKVKSRENIEMILDSSPKEIIGENKVQKIKVINNTTKDIKDFDVDGVFVEIGRTAKTDIINEFVDLDDKGQIIVDERCQTKTEGVFAAGDITNVPYKQITIACGQATIAALSAYQYLQLKK